MLKFKNAHAGSRCFIAATGPSLNMIDVSKLDGEFVIGLNRAYLKDGLNITYLCVVNDLVEKHYGNEIVNLKCKAKFVNSLTGRDVYQFRWTPDVPKFSGDITEPIWQGHTVTYAAMQLAYFMGFSEVYTVGLDHYFNYESFNNLGKALVESGGNDLNHFDTSYFDKGHEHLKAEPRVTEKAYLLARKAYEDSGRVLANASKHTALGEEFLPRVDFDNLFRG